MAMALSRILNKKGKQIPPGDQGLELELEFAESQVWDLNEKLWTVHSDELSLRNCGYEISATVPLKMDSLEAVIEPLCENINRRNPIVSNRTSTHVHENMLRHSVLQVLNCIVVYWLLETPLTRYCGEEREGHHFNLRLKDAEAMVPILCDSLKSDRPLRDLGDKVRYAGLNLSALNKFGSLEFRSMRGSTDPKLIVSWMKAIHHLCSVAKTFESPAHVFDFYLDCNKDKFVRHFLPEDLANVVLNTPGYSQMMDESASIVCALAYTQPWKDWDEKLSQKLKAKEVNTPNLYGAMDFYDEPVATYID